MWAEYFDLILPNGSVVTFRNATGQAPMESSPIPLTPPASDGGWAKAYDAATWGVQGGVQYILLVNKDKSEMRFDYSYPFEPGFHNLSGATVFRPTKITVKVGNYITVDYLPEQRPVQVYDAASTSWPVSDVSTRNRKVGKQADVAILPFAHQAQLSYWLGGLKTCIISAGAQFGR